VDWISGRNCWNPKTILLNKNARTYINFNTLIYSINLLLFQLLFLKVTRNTLSLNVKTRCIFHAFRCCATGLIAATFQSVKPYFRLRQMPCTFLIIATINCYVALWITTCKSLSSAGKSLSRNFKVWHRKLI
jgi:hypothetical protein